MDNKEPMRLLPLGITDYRTLREQNYYFVDKTEYINTIEYDSHFLLFARPPRFGKSLFVSMLKEYYDILAQDRYEQNFRDTWIYNNPLRDRGRYLILHFDFSKVKGDFSNLEENFNAYCSGVLDNFIKKYSQYFKSFHFDRALAAESAFSKFNIIMGGAESARLDVFIIADNYDFFINRLMASPNEEDYWSIRNALIPYRRFLHIFKADATRYLLIGNVSVSFNDLSGCCNNYTEVTNYRNLNMALGFSQDEVEAMMRYYQEQGAITKPLEDIIEEIKPWYGNYCFAAEKYGVDSTLYNPSQVLYYLNSLIKTGSAPDDMLDENAHNAFNDLKHFVRLDHWDYLKKILDNGYVHTRIRNTIPAEGVINTDLFLSYLYYYGMLTIGGEWRYRLNLVIPNRTAATTLRSLSQYK